jgi:hypothetical protein
MVSQIEPTADDWLAAGCPVLFDAPTGGMHFSCFTDELGVCGCGDPEASVRFLVQTLERARDRFWPLIEGEQTIERELLLHWMTQKEWIEHGSNVYGSWITEGGTRALRIAHGWLKCDAEDDR